jgi:GTPase SAR1 family protein
MVFVVQDSFEAVKTFWINELRHQCSSEGGLVICLAGNKCDLEHLRVSSCVNCSSFVDLPICFY